MAPKRLSYALALACASLILIVVSSGGGREATRPSKSAAPGSAGPSFKNVSWMLLGARSGGRELTVGLAEDASSCSSYRVLATESRRTVRIRVQRKDCVGAVTADSAMPSLPPVKLRTPLDGRKVLGPKKTQRVRFNRERGDRHPFELPDLIGLTPQQAREVTRTFNISMSPSGNATGGHVVDQTPRGGDLGDDSTVITVELSGG